MRLAHSSANRARAPRRAAPGGAAATYAAIDAFVTQLVRSGLRHVCVAPGARSTPLTLVLAGQPGLRVWSHIDERSAAFFALGLAKAARTPVAVVCTSGTAAANLLPAVVEAAYARVPLLLLTADRPPELRECGAPQAIDQLRLFGQHAKWFVEVGGCEAGMAYFRSLGCRAMATAAAIPAGPVHLNFPFREPLAPDTPLAARAARPPVGRPPTPHTAVHEPLRLLAAASIDAIAARLTAARRGVIVCGPLDHDAAARDAIARLATRFGLPVLADATSQLRNGTHDTSAVIDAYDALLRDAAFAADAQPDLVLRIGPLPTSKALAAWLRGPLAGPPPWPARGPHTIVVDPSGGWNDPLHAAAAMVHCDVAPLCAALAERGQPARERAWLDRWRAAARGARAALDAGLAALREPFEGTVLAELARRLPDGATLYVGNSMPMRDLELFWPCSPRRVRILSNRGANGIDGFVSSALGAAAAGGAPLVAVSGDLGLLHDLNGLLAAKRLAARATFVVLNNDGGGIFSYLPQAERAGAAFTELFLTPHHLDLRGGVEMHGCGFERVRTPLELAAALDAALASPRTEVIEVPIDRARSVALHRALWAAAARAGQEAGS